jgi:hypothetical protein
MVYDLMDTSCAEDGELSIAPEGILAEKGSPVLLQSNSHCSELGLPVLAAQCLREIDTYRRGEPCTDTYGLELFRRASIHSGQEAWAGVQHCFSGVVFDWFRRHPQRAYACHQKSEEHYVAQAFERFWQASASHQRMACNTLAAALHSLRVNLHGVILDTLRAYERPWETLFLEPRELGKPYMEEVSSSSEVWEMMQTLLPERREHRVAYLLFHCGLKPPEIVRLYPLEWSEVHEIYRLRHTILQRFLRNAEHLH